MFNLNFTCCDLGASFSAPTKGNVSAEAVPALLLSVTTELTPACLLWTELTPLFHARMQCGFQTDVIMDFFWSGSCLSTACFEVWYANLTRHSRRYGTQGKGYFTPLHPSLLLNIPLISPHLSLPSLWSS